MNEGDAQTRAAAAPDGQDLVSGLFLVAVGVAAFLIGRPYSVGSAIEMGPGYVPRLLCAGLVLVGLALAGRGIVRRGFAVAGWDLRSVLPILAAILAFGLAVERLGMVLAGIGVVVLAMLGERQPAWRQMPVIALALAGGCALLFGWALGLSLPILPR